MTATAPIITIPIATLMSRVSAAVAQQAARGPGQEKTVSVMTAPLKRAPRSRATRVTRGARALRSAWAISTRRSESPRARAAWTYSERSTSIIAARSNRLHMATFTRASVRTGSTRCWRWSTEKNCPSWSKEYRWLV